MFLMYTYQKFSAVSVIIFFFDQVYIHYIDVNYSCRFYIEFLLSDAEAKSAHFSIIAFRSQSCIFNTSPKASYIL